MFRINPTTTPAQRHVPMSYDDDLVDSINSSDALVWKGAVMMAMPLGCCCCCCCCCSDVAAAVIGSTTLPSLHTSNYRNRMPSGFDYPTRLRLAQTVCGPK